MITITLTEEQIRSILLQLMAENNAVKEYPLVRNLDVSSRLNSVLIRFCQMHQIDFKTANIYDLSKFTIKQFRGIRGYGLKSENELLEIFSEHGLTIDKK